MQREVAVVAIVAVVAVVAVVAGKKIIPFTGKL